MEKLTVKQLSEIAEVPTKTLYRWAKTGIIPSIPHNRGVRFPVWLGEHLLTQGTRNLPQPQTIKHTVNVSKKRSRKETSLAKGDSLWE
jgi:hypothetical protein